ncbi:PadR family transcriptional regulator [candidate division KSB1 bacterium]
MEIITRLEEVILMAVWRLKDNAYGVSINKEVSGRTGKNYSMGSLYFSLDQLVRKEYLIKIEGTPTHERGGRRKIFYRLSSEGIEALKTARKLEETLWEGVSELTSE